MTVLPPGRYGSAAEPDAVSKKRVSQSRGREEEDEEEEGW